MSESSEIIASAVKIPANAFLQVFAWIARPFLKSKYGLSTYSPMMFPACYQRENFPEQERRTFYCMPCLDDRGKMSVIAPKGDELSVMFICPRCKHEVQFNVHPSHKPG